MGHGLSVTHDFIDGINECGEIVTCKAIDFSYKGHANTLCHLLRSDIIRVHQADNSG